jgi:hypothetical protein
VEQAAVLADRGGERLQLLAAARVLQVCDEATLGRERVSGLMKLLEPCVRNELPITYAETVAEILVQSEVLTPGEQRRLGLLLIEAWFHAGTSPQVLQSVLKWTPWLNELHGSPDDYLMQTLYFIWVRRRQKNWPLIGSATSIFEYAATRPADANRLLTRYADVVLVLPTQEAIRRDLGDVVITTKGLGIGGKIIADLSGEVRFSSSGHELFCGQHRLVATQKLPITLVDTIKNGLRFRSEVLIPQTERLISNAILNHNETIKHLSPYRTQCSLCRSACVVRRGQIGMLMQ